MSASNRTSPRATASSTNTAAYPNPATPTSGDSPNNHHRRTSSILTPEQQQFLERRLSHRRPNAGTTSSTSAVDTLADNLQAKLNATASPARPSATAQQPQSSSTATSAVAADAGSSNITQPTTSSATFDAMASTTAITQQQSTTSDTDALAAAVDAATSPPVDSSEVHRRTASTRVEAALQRRNSQSIQPPPTGVDTTRVSPLLHAPQKQLERNLARANLYHALKHRPSLDDLQSQGIYVNNKVDSNASGRSTIQQLQQQYETNEAIASGAIQRPSPAIPHNAATSAPATTQPAYNPSAPSQQTSVYNFHQSATSPQSAPNAQSQQLYQRRSKLFHLTRILLRAARTLAETQQLNAEQVGALKDLIVDSNTEVLDAAELFDHNNDSQLFRQTLSGIATKVAEQLSSHNGA